MTKQNLNTVKLPSGAELKLNVAPFADSKALYQALLDEAKNLKLDPKAEMDVNFFKDIFCYGFSSKKVEECLYVCMKRATYKGAAITDESFEPEDCRQDYFQVLYEVARANVAPFTKSLYAQLKVLSEGLQSFQS